MRRLVALTVAVLVGWLGVTGCSDDADEPEAQGPTLAQVLARAKAALDRAGSVRFALRADQLPEGVPGLLSATGVGTHDPAFRGEVQAAQGGITVTADVVAAKGGVWAKFGFSPIYIGIDPDDYGAPDPAVLMDRQRGLSSLLTAATGLREEGRTRSGEQVLTAISGTIPGERVAAIFPTAAGAEPFAATFRIDDTSRLRDVEITGPFYGDGPPVGYTVTFESYGGPVEITPP